MSFILKFEEPLKDFKRGKDKSRFFLFRELWQLCEFGWQARTELEGLLSDDR